MVQKIMFPMYHLIIFNIHLGGIPHFQTHPYHWNHPDRPLCETTLLQGHLGGGEQLFGLEKRWKHLVFTQKMSWNLWMSIPKMCTIDLDPPPYSKYEKPGLIVWYRFSIIHHAMLWLLRNYPGFESDEYNLPESIQFCIFRGKSRKMQFILAFAWLVLRYGKILANVWLKGLNPSTRLSFGRGTSSATIKI